MYVIYPYQLDGHGRTAATTDRDDHIRQMLEQLLFTRPGERVNRPDFGCGLGDLVFEPNSAQLAAALEVAIVSSIGQWLGDLIQLQNVAVESQDSQLLVTIDYLVKASGQSSSTTVAVASP